MSKDRALVLPANATLWDAYNKGVSDTVDGILADLESLDYWITDNQERTKDEYDRKIIDWYETHKEILARKAKYEDMKND